MKDKERRVAADGEQIIVDLELERLEKIEANYKKLTETLQTDAATSGWLIHQIEWQNRTETRIATVEDRMISLDETKDAVAHNAEGVEHNAAAAAKVNATVRIFTLIIIATIIAVSGLFIQEIIRYGKSWKAQVESVAVENAIDEASDDESLGTNTPQALPQESGGSQPDSSTSVGTTPATGNRGTELRRTDGQETPGGQDSVRVESRSDRPRRLDSAHEGVGHRPGATPSTREQEREDAAEFQIDSEEQLQIRDDGDGSGNGGSGSGDRPNPFADTPIGEITTEAAGIVNPIPTAPR